MKTIWDDDQFCRDFTQDILSDAELSTLCAQTVKTVRRRRKIEQTTRIAILGLIVMAGWYGLRPTRHQDVVRIVPRVEQTYTLVKTEPFEGVIRSQPLQDRGNFFANLPRVTVMRSHKIPELIKISDEELLSLTGGRAVALSRRPNGGMELNFLD